MRMLRTATRKATWFWRDQKGITGLETAIVLIAFVVVASVFAYSVLNTGLFSADRSKESIHAGMAQTRSNLELKGAVVAESDAGKNKVEKVKFYVSTAAGSEPVDFTKANLVLTYQDDVVHEVIDSANNLDINARGSRDNGDALLDPGELREIEVTLPDTVTLATNQMFNLELRPPVGSVLNITRTTPPALKTIMNLN